MPISTLPLALISDGVTAKAARVITSGDASAAAPSARKRRRLISAFVLCVIISSLVVVLFMLSPRPASSRRGHGQPAFEPRAVERQRPADCEVESAYQAEDEQRLEVLVGNDGPGPHQLGKADDRCE